MNGPSALNGPRVQVAEIPWGNGRAGSSEDLMALMAPPAWHAQAACRGMDSKVFYPEAGSTAAGAIAYQAARAICSGCPVSTQCQEAGAGEAYGCWGGVTPVERRQARRRIA